eukprot:Nitzschia sp. Nitz4//scaffold67_size101165//45231//45602//NITZ4_004526-RA/size101165-processed-gene-0.90-mRNA-1//1//CDS//3329556465//5709//frame0
MDDSEGESDDESDGVTPDNSTFLADMEKFEETAHLYANLRNLERSMYKQSFPITAWPMLLDKLGTTTRYPGSVTIQNAGKDAIFHALSRLLSDGSWIRCNNRKRKREESSETAFPNIPNDVSA